MPDASAPPTLGFTPRCYDCLAPVPTLDDLLCGSCKALYADKKERRRG